MLEKLKIFNYKCFADAEIDFAPLTIVTGTNSSGKSSVLQSILLSAYYIAPIDEFETRHRISELSNVLRRYSVTNFREVVNRYSTEKIIKFNLLFSGKESAEVEITDDHKGRSNFKNKKSSNLTYEKNLFYLSANRTGQDEIATINSSLKIGHNGDCAIGTFDSEKDNPIHSDLIFDSKSITTTLKHNLAFWLSRITDYSISFQTERISTTLVRPLFIVEDLGDKSPNLVGAGNSYLVTLLIMCLLANPGDMLLIENPEIHLHPSAQSKTGEFLAFIASKGVQLIVETHSEHLINRIRYEVYDSQSSLVAKQVIIHYKPKANENFISIFLNESGQFVNLENNRVNFPHGYFDATLDKLLEIG